MGFHRSTVKGLPEGAQIQVIKGVPYVYFRYTWKDESGKVKYARDYLGVVEEGVFVPNDYYLRLRPTKDNRPDERWSVTNRKSKTPQAVMQTQSVSAQQTPELSTQYVGVTALLMSLLRESRWGRDLKALLGDDAQILCDVINLVLSTALRLSPKPLYDETLREHRFYANASCSLARPVLDIHTRLGSALVRKRDFIETRLSRLSDDEWMSLNGALSMLPPEIDGIRKVQSFTLPSSFSLLVNAKTGALMGYRTSNKTVSLSSLHVWDDVMTGRVKRPLGVIPAVNDSHDELLQWGAQGYRFVVGATAESPCVQTVIATSLGVFHKAQSLLAGEDLYARQEVQTWTGEEGSLRVNVSVFRDPILEMQQTRQLLAALSQFEDDWLAGRATSDDRLMAYFKRPNKATHGALIKDHAAVSQACAYQGFFAVLTNEDLSLEESLAMYRLRGEVEMLLSSVLTDSLSNGAYTTREAWEGLLFTSFLTIGLVTHLRVKILAKSAGLSAQMPKSAVDVLHRLKKIQIVTITGKTYLINASEEDKNLVASLGFPGLFDSVGSALVPLSEPL